MVLVGGVTLWAHQTLLTADGWGGIVEDVISEEEVTEAISVVIVDRLAESLGFEYRQTLIVIHGKNCVEFLKIIATEKTISRIWSKS